MTNKIKKIVLLGPESTGKSTLARLLAQHFHCLWCPEFARTYLSMKNDIENRYTQEIVSTYEDIEPIAIGQLAMEDAFIDQSDAMLFFDTNLLTNLIYSDYYFQKHPDWLAKQVLSRDYDLYLLLDIDVAWEADPLRDRPNAREEIYAIFRNILIKYQSNFIEINGLGQERVDNAVKAINSFFKIK
jgi:NadR type nicotinamide-nucleotide adenylyltransferase